MKKTVIKPFAILTKYMKHIFIAIILLLAIGETHAQKWFTPASKWYYGAESAGPITHNSPLEISFVKDTIIEGKLCLKYQTPFENVTNYLGSLSSFYIHSDTLTQAQHVYFNGRFQVLYDFNKQIGDTLFIPAFGETRHIIASDSGTWVRIDSTGFDTIGGKVFRTMYYADLFPWQYDWVYSGKVIEGIGNITGLYPDARNQPYALRLTGLRCYQDDSLDLKWGNIACDSVVSTSLNKIDLLKNNISIYPNPFKENLAIDLSKITHKVSKITIINNIGQVVLNNEIIVKNNVINLSTEKLKNGLYFCIITINNNILTYKILKQ